MYTALRGFDQPHVGLSAVVQPAAFPTPDVTGWWATATDWLAGSTFGIPNKYLALGGGAFLLLTLTKK